ncbi:protein MKS1 [Pistacia vera]|uniref:protein MKS1 n=1 Tax=Pistacia vera TaxID=55513 RepID=UPI001263D238|nr:protein MKS1 [Pistacia vera]
MNDPSHHAPPQPPSDAKKPPSPIQGPRPPPLSINKNSHKIKKPPKPPLPQQPIIIYSVSPKIINVAVSDFMTTVQRLTGVSSDDFCTGGDVSPAARLASTEKVISPKEKALSVEASEEMVEEGIDVGQIPGILSPSMLPPLIPERYFSPAGDPYSFPSFLASPGSGLFPGSMGSPIFSPEIFGQIWNF